MPEEIITKIFLGTVPPEALEPEMDPEGYIIKSDSEGIYIIGHSEDSDPLDALSLNVGLLWGAYEFIERAVGVRWLWPGELGTYIPRHDSIFFPYMEVAWEPKLKYRNLRWSRLHRVLDEDYRYYHLYERIGFSETTLKEYASELQRFRRTHRIGGNARRPRAAGHRFSGWWDRLGDKHPEWFMLNEDGSRGAENYPPNRSRREIPMCVSNRELHEYLVRLWDGKSMIQLGEVDMRDACHCSDCKAWDALQIPYEELPEFLKPVTVPFSEARSVYNPMVVSDRYARFWKSVLELAKERNPDAQVSTYLYVNYFPAPTNDIYLGEDVFGEFVPWSNLHAEYFPMSDEALEWVKEQWLGWEKTGMRIGYRPNYLLDGYVMPQVNTYQAAEFFKWAVEHGMIGADFDSLTGQWATQGPKLYLHLRIVADPDRDIDEVLNEYYEGFGPAGDAVRAYFDYWEAYAYENMWDTNVTYEKVGSRWQRFQLYAHRVFPDESFVPAERLLQIALGDAEDDPDPQYADRVRFLQLGLEHAKLSAKVAAMFDGERTIPLNTERHAQARAALIDLIMFRKAYEDLYISDYYYQARPEVRFWDIKGLLDSIEDKDFVPWDGPD